MNLPINLDSFWKIPETGLPFNSKQRKNLLSNTQNKLTSCFCKRQALLSGKRPLVIQ